MARHRAGFIRRRWSGRCAPWRCRCPDRPPWPSLAASIAVSADRRADAVNSRSLFRRLRRSRRRRCPCTSITAVVCPGQDRHRAAERRVVHRRRWPRACPIHRVADHRVGRADRALGDRELARHEPASLASLIWSMRHRGAVVVRIVTVARVGRVDRDLRIAAVTLVQFTTTVSSASTIASSTMPSRRSPPWSPRPIVTCP